MLAGPVGSARHRCGYGIGWAYTAQCSPGHRCDAAASGSSVRGAAVLPVSPIGRRAPLAGWVVPSWVQASCRFWVPFPKSGFVGAKASHHSLI
jgi:hypothetical protein